MEYIQYEVQEDLRPFIKCYWSLEAPAADKPERQRIVPDGCMEMIIHYGDLYQQYLPDGHSVMQPRGFVFGQITTALEIGPSGTTGIIAARFQPEGFFPFSTLPVTALADKATPLNTLFGEEGAALETMVLQAPDNQTRIGILDRFFLSKLQTAEAAERVATAAVQALLESREHNNIHSLSGQLQVHRRRLERKFIAATGLSPKQFSKIARLQAALKLISTGEYTSLTALALEAGYYDQAHFIRDFREFTGVSPGQFYAASLKMAALFIDTR